MKIAITGAFSYSGKYITERLLARGEEIVTLTNHPNRAAPFRAQVQVFPLNFGDEAGLTAALRGAPALINTYWVRFDRGANTQARAVENTRRLVRAALAAGVRRIVHISICNPSIDSTLSYFRGKAQNERAVIESGLSYCILRPTVLFGREDVLINNIAWLLRRFPLFFIPGDGRYRLQPIHVDDLADLAVEGVYEREDVVRDAAGPDVLSFEALVRLIAQRLSRRPRLLHVPPRLALAAARCISLMVGDVVLTKDEMDGLTAELLVSAEPPRGKIRLGDWLAANCDQIGTRYASELERHYRVPG